MDTCEVCGRMYPAFYLAKHKCKGKPILAKDFPCHLCNVVCSYKSNFYRHYKKYHHLERDEIPLARTHLKRESLLYNFTHFREQSSRKCVKFALKRGFSSDFHEFPRFFFLFRRVFHEFARGLKKKNEKVGRKMRHPI